MGAFHIQIKINWQPQYFDMVVVEKNDISGALYIFDTYSYILTSPNYSMRKVIIKQFVLCVIEKTCFSAAPRQEHHDETNHFIPRKKNTAQQARKYLLKWQEIKTPKLW